MNKPKLDAATLQRMMAAKLPPPSPLPIDGAESGKSSFLNPTESGVATIHVDDIEIYDRNPRTIENSAFLAIKGSIKVSGIKTPLTVTRIPTQAKGKYTTAAGGGTRLTALRELHREEPDNPLFARTTCLIVPYPGELQMLAAHVIENTQRSDMCWWDEASGIATIRDQLEADLKTKLSIRELEAKIKELGLSTNKTEVTDCIYTATHLVATGAYTTHLKRTEVRSELQPLHTGLRSLLRVSSQTPQQEADAIWSELLTAYFGLLSSPESYKFADLVEVVHAKLAESLGVAAGAVKSMLEAVKRDSKLPYAVLLAAAQETSQTQTEIRSDGNSDAAPEEETASDPESSETQPIPDVPASSPHFGAPAVLPKPNATPTLPIPSTLPPRISPAMAGHPVTQPLVLQKQDGLNTVYQAAKALAEYAGLDGCVMACEAAPIGYYMDLPAGVVLTPAESLFASQGLDHTIWWCLYHLAQVAITDPEAAAAIEYLPEGALLKVALRGDDEFSAAINTRIGEPLPMRDVGLLTLWSCEDSGRGALARNFVESVAAVQKSTRWLTVSAMPGGDA